MDTRRRAATESTLISLSRAKEENPIVITVQGQKEADDRSYRMGRKTPMRNLMLDYCDRTGAVYESTRFLYNGSHINPFDTADGLAMEDEDVIDAFPELQTGGYVPS